MERMQRANEVEQQVSRAYRGTYINEMADILLNDGRFIEVKSVLEHNGGKGHLSRAGKVRFKAGQLDWLRQRGALVAIVVIRSSGQRDLYEIAAQDIPGDHVSYRSILAAGAQFKGVLV